MKNILVPTDFSDCAKLAETVGLEIARKANAEIHFLHILSTPVDWVNLPLKNEKLYPNVRAQINHAKNLLDKLVSKAEKSGLKAKQFLIFNKGREEIDRHISRHHHDFIVMGSRGAEGLRKIIGSNTQKVVRYSKAPVLVVKKKSKKFEIKNMVFASTFEGDVSKPFHKIIEFADLMGAQIHLLYVNMPFHFKESDEVEAIMQKFLKKCPRETCSINIHNSMDEERGILQFSKRIKADLIALTTHGKTGFMKIMAPSITESLVNHSDIPVLSVNIEIE